MPPDAPTHGRGNGARSGEVEAIPPTGGHHDLDLGLAGTIASGRTGGRVMEAFVHEALPGRVVFGAGTTARVAEEVAGLGDPQRALVIASGSAATIAQRIAADLGRRFAASFSEVRQHVPEELAAAACQAAAEHEVDAVVTVGGGSAIGLGKAVAVRRGAPLLAVPTTYSGSEMTPIYGITGREKRTVRDLRALPKVVVYDPELTLGLPIRVGASSGLNALAHAVEALYAGGANPVTSLWAMEAIRRLAEALPAMTSGPTDVGARCDALYGSYLAGAAFAVAGTALQHKLAHVLGGRFGLNHADTHAVLLPHVAAFNAMAVPDTMAGVVAALTLATRAPGAASTAAGGADPGDVGGCLHRLAGEVGAPTSLAELGLPEQGLDEAAALGVAAVGRTNPRPVDQESLRALLQAAYEGRAPA